MEYTESFLDEVVGLGMLGYSLQKIINVLEIEQQDVIQFISDFDDPNSLIAQAFRKGIDQGDYQIDMKLYEMAKAGDLNALKKYESRKREQALKEEKDKDMRDMQYKLMR